VQSTSSCSERSGRDPVEALARPSRAETAANAQHEPHEPWFLMALTLPCDLQSMASFLPVKVVFGLKTLVTFEAL